MKGTSMNGNVYALSKLDGWATVYMAHTATPGHYAAHGSVFRGFQEQRAAVKYAEQVAEFFGQHGLEQPVFVLRGPTSTSRTAFEVADATAGYPVLARAIALPAKAPSAGMTLRTAIACFGLQALRGLPIDDGSGRTLFISDRCLERDLDVYSDTPSEAFRIHRFYGGESPDCAMVEWISTNTSRIADGERGEEEALIDAGDGRERQRA